MHEEIIQQIEKLNEKLIEKNIFMGGKGFYQVLDEQTPSGKKNSFFCSSLETKKKYLLEFAPEDLNHVELQKYLRRALFLLVLDKNKKVIRAVDFSIDPARSFVIIDYVVGKNLMSILRETRLTLKESLWILLDLTEAMEHLADFNFVHRNIHPGSISIAEKSAEAYLVDFEYITQSDFLQTKIIEVDVQYASPELVRSLMFPNQQILLTTESDIYSLGCIFYQMSNGITPFDSKRNMERWSHKPYVPKMSDRSLPRKERKYCQNLLNYLMHPKWFKRWQPAKIREYILAYLGDSQRSEDMFQWI